MNLAGKHPEYRMSLNLYVNDQNTTIWIQLHNGRLEYFMTFIQMQRDDNMFKEKVSKVIAGKCWPKNRIASEFALFEPLLQLLEP